MAVEGFVDLIGDDGGNVGILLDNFIDWLIVGGFGV